MQERIRRRTTLHFGWVNKKRRVVMEYLMVCD